MPKVKFAPQKLIFTVLFVAFVIYSVTTMISLANQINDNRETIELQNQQITAQQKRALELNEQTSKIGTDEFIEKQAKEKLGYVKSNEKIFYDKAQ